MLVIRAKAGTNLNNSDPEDAFTLNSYLTATNMAIRL
jgi:hypothetical protein